MGTVIDFRTLNARYCTSLVFAAFEGLRDGEILKVISDKKPTDLQAQFEEAKINNAHWRVACSGPEVWEMSIYKLDKARVGCCGICGV